MLRLKFVSRLTVVIFSIIAIYTFSFIIKDVMQEPGSDMLFFRQEMHEHKVIDSFQQYLPRERRYNNKTPNIFKNRCHKKQNNVVFLKVHKAGSTTVMNIFLRFADSHGLNIVFPNVSNYLGYDRTIDLDKILPPPRKETYNVLCNHVIYSRSLFDSIMPSDTMYIGIVRHPESQTVSAAQYFGLLDFMKETRNLSHQILFSEFIQDPYTAPSGYQKFLHNRMSKDFGIPRNDFLSADKVFQHAERLYSDFTLIMVLELFDESLVLLKRRLCWDLKDIIYNPLNSIPPEDKVTIEDKDKKHLYQYNKADFILYQT